MARKKRENSISFTLYDNPASIEIKISIFFTFGGTSSLMANFRSISTHWMLKRWIQNVHRKWTERNMTILLSKIKKNQSEKFNAEKIVPHWTHPLNIFEWNVNICPLLASALNSCCSISSITPWKCKTIIDLMCRQWIDSCRLLVFLFTKKKKITEKK